VVDDVKSVERVKIIEYIESFLDVWRFIFVIEGENAPFWSLSVPQVSDVFAVDQDYAGARVSQPLPQVGRCAQQGLLFERMLGFNARR